MNTKSLKELPENSPAKFAAINCSPVYEHDGVTFLLGDCRKGMKQIEPGSVQTCVTSPPYWGLRDYGHDGQIGQEATPEKFVETMVDVFRHVRDTLADDGTLWLNLGDSYYGSWANYGGGNRGAGKQRLIKHGSHAQNPVWEGLEGYRPPGTFKHPVIKPKDLVGIPWRVALALQADGWYLRQDIIWHKPNPMPESVTDRCTKAHEYIFLLSKSERYYFDSQAIQEPAEYAGQSRGGSTNRYQQNNAGMDNREYETRNKRSVWSVNVKPYKGAHFATFPPDLIEPCVRAGCPEGGLVLDPFLGSGTTAEVAKRFGRRFVGCELNPEYVEIAKRRFKQQTMF